MLAIMRAGGGLSATRGSGVWVFASILVVVYPVVDCGRSEVSAPAIRYFALEFAAGEHLFARCLDLLSDPPEIPAES